MDHAAWQHEYRMCSRKVKYASPHKARRAMKFLKNKKPGAMTTYQCPYCGQHHIGHKTKKGDSDGV